MSSATRSDSGAILVVQHVACETLGTIEGALESRGLAHRYIRVHAGEKVPSSIGDAAGLIVMGGPMSVYDYGHLTHLMQEMRLLGSALASHRPVLGICLGSQLLAHVLGAKVYPAAKKEIGWHRVMLTEEAQHDPLWSVAPKTFPAFHWHGDVFDLPRNTVSLAKSGLTSCQAYRYGASAYGILFHLEMTAPLIQGIASTFADELHAVGGTAEELARNTTDYLPNLAEIGNSVFDGWAKLVAEPASVPVSRQNPL